MKNILSIILFTFCVTGCENKEVEKINAPDCIVERINTIKKETVRNPPAKVFSMTYNGSTVYYIPPSCCDAFSELLDENCNLLCSPDGGITGGGDGRCPDFRKNISNEKLVWSDDRK
ncbi:DUF6970 domain-containing protein [Dyadobacter sp. CY356]|uniref:DUF6970 domain-containing protein n=1 Tax=Dyadobacter sp. CY356 TaxID=2906442 RepID=UPI001F43EF14|nr:hypothetical protein [Dyadobacter sp. CY356]MCF0055011.1 hypothetical protein [Dyadobacter sp. CY356]